MVLCICSQGVVLPFGYIKPEVVAPGVELTGTYPGNRYGTMTGTSVAAAFVAGISALFMQEYADDGANSNTVREALIRGRAKRENPIRIPSGVMALLMRTGV